MNKKEYLVEVKVKNNNLALLMRDAGISSAAELAKKSDVSPGQVGDILNLKKAATNKDGSIRAPVQKIADFFNVLPEHLFPEECFCDPLHTNKAEFEASYLYMASVSNSIGFEANETILNVIDTLNPREADVIRRRFGLDGNDRETLDDIGRSYDISKERVRMIESKALRKLRRPERSEQLREIHYASNRDTSL